MQKNYPEKVIDDKFKKAKKKDRKEIIFQQRKKKKENDNKTRLIFTYNERNPPIYSWIQTA